MEVKFHNNDFKKNETNTYVISLWKMQACQTGIFLKQIKTPISYFKMNKRH